MPCPYSLFDFGRFIGLFFVCPDMFAQSVALACDIDQLGMVEEAVQYPKRIRWHRQAEIRNTMNLNAAVDIHEQPTGSTWKTHMTLPAITLQTSGWPGSAGSSLANNRPIMIEMVK